MIASTLLAIVASAALTIGLYYMKREADCLPALEARRPSTFLSFLRAPWWLAGVALQTFGYGLYLWSLRGAPLSVVHTALTAGIAFFVLLAVFGLGERMRRQEWWGVAAVVSGLVFLALSLTEETAALAEPRGALGFALSALVFAGLAYGFDRSAGRAIGLSVASGVILGLAGIFAKQLANVQSVTEALVSSALLLTLATNITGFILMQAALQRGRGVVVVPILSTLSNLVPILGGMLVFGEAMPRTGGAAWLRPLSIVLALAGAAALAGFGESTAPPSSSPPCQGKEQGEVA